MNTNKTNFIKHSKITKILTNIMKIPQNIKIKTNFKY